MAGNPAPGYAKSVPVSMSTAVVFTLPRSDAGAAAALRSIVAATQSPGIPVVAVTLGAADPAAVRAWCEPLGVRVIEAGRDATFGAAANAIGKREIASTIGWFSSTRPS